MQSPAGDQRNAGTTDSPRFTAVASEVLSARRKSKRNQTSEFVRASLPATLQPPQQLQDGEFLRLRFNFDGESALLPLGREVSRVDVVVMPLRFRAGPAFERAGDVKERFAISGRDGLFGDGLDAQSIRQAAVMVTVINERHTRVRTDRQQVGRRVNLVVVLQG